MGGPTLKVVDPQIEPAQAFTVTVPLVTAKAIP
jgi:hypothetical protein